MHNTFHGDAETVIQAGSIGRVHLYGIPFQLTPLSRWAFLRRCAVTAALVASGGFLLSTGLTASTGRKAPWLVVTGLALLMTAHSVGWVTWQCRQLSRGRYENALRATVNGVLAGLAREQTARWRDEAIARRVQGPRLLPVLCRTAERALFDHWSAIRTGERSDEPLPLDGDVTEIDRLYGLVPSGRLVILGEPGAGKSVAALRLGLRLLERRQPADRVPVILPLASWNPADTGLWRWAARRLATEHPELAAPTGFGTTLAEEVARPERLLLILEGLDEMPAERRSVALRTLNESLDEHTHLILTSRTEQYRNAVRRADVLSGAAAVTLRPLTVRELSQYLRTSTRRTRSDGTPLWEPVLARMRDGDDPHALRLRAVLSSPLMLGLALAVYGETAADPAELLDTAAFPTRARIEKHLIARLVPAVYTPPPDVGKPPRWRAEDAERHLSRLARDAARHGAPGGELAWWRWYPGQAKAATAVAVTLVYGAAVALTAALPPHGTIRWWGMTLPPWAALAVLGVLPLLVALVDVHATEPVPARLQLRRRMPTVLRRAAASAAGVGFAWLTGIPTEKDPYPAGFPVPVAIALGVLFVVRAAPSMPTDVASATPRSLLRADRVSTLTLAVNHSVTGPRRWCLEAVVLFPVLILDTWSDHAGAEVTGPAAWATLLSGVLAITVVHGITNTAWGRHAAGRVVLAATGRLPWRTMAFLEDAHARGVLRQSGGVFQFRHARLQEHLLGEAPPARDGGVRARPHPRAVRLLRRWPAPLLAGVVLAVGSATVPASVSQVRRPAGPYAVPAPACSLLDGPTVTSALHGAPVRDRAARNMGGLYAPWPRDDDGWCSWHTEANASRLALATDAETPTPDRSGAEIAKDVFAGLTTGPGTRAHADPSATPCDWRHEHVEPGSGEATARAVLLCRNVLFEIDYDAPAGEPSDPAEPMQRLLRLAVREGLRTRAGTSP
ncbi:NACHT domain-containing protein [Streptomyces barringtoniae]|uniref:NACHT domain-containing protein n=1 Tax=Streptomyces barringtoniae TaxID=2892029 RepID=UPI001E3FCC5C|nr:NACHT domain-containing protein [Streptomyces barringtoniae]MCC5480307.1 NACHT domain-containing protein [Streptomyces barringtoniae]